MALQRVDITVDKDMPVETLFEELAEHENLARVFGAAKVERLNDGYDSRNGVGSARSIAILGTPPFVETVTEYRKNERIAYRITKGSPLRNHHGLQEFEAIGPNRSRIHWVITFEGRAPLVGPIVRFGLQTAITRGLKALGGTRRSA